MEGNEHYYEKLDEAVTVYLRKNGMTQAQLAEKMGMAENTFSWKRRGVREFTLSEVTKLANIVGFSLDEVVEGG